MRNIWSFQTLVTYEGKPPKLPDTIDELNDILKKTGAKLKLVKCGTIARFGTNSECYIMMECPYCNSQFTRYHEEGCFHGLTIPMVCPVCGFPNTVFGKIYQLATEKQEKKKEPWKFEARFTKAVKLRK